MTTSTGPSRRAMLAGAPLLALALAGKPATAKKGKKAQRLIGEFYVRYASAQFGISPRQFIQFTLSFAGWDLRPKTPLQRVGTLNLSVLAGDLDQFTKLVQRELCTAVLNVPGSQASRIYVRTL